jgi:hypothetical protein
MPNISLCMPLPHGNAQHIAPTNRYFVTILTDERPKLKWGLNQLPVTSDAVFSGTNVTAAVAQMSLPKNSSDHYYYSQFNANFFRPTDIVSFHFLIPTLTAHNSRHTNHLSAHCTSYLLTPWSRVLLEKLTGLQLVKKFLTFYGTRRFLTAITSARHVSLS